MEKISGVIPASPRVQAVDLKSSAPIRPGIPTFGRPLGSNSLAERQGMTTAERAHQTHQEVMAQRKSQTERDVEAIKDIAERFFMMPSAPIPGSERPSHISGQEEVSRWGGDGVSSGDWIEGLETSAQEGQYLDYAPPGTYLDVEV